VSDPAPALPDATLDDTLAALADPVRRRAVELLAERPRRAGELAGELGTTPSAMSKHLRVLRQRGLVSEAHPEFDARVRIYALRSAPMTELRGWLDTAERAWATQLTAFAAHLDAER
jgi:DNA-binding transcriptional ArsR family regulator